MKYVVRSLTSGPWKSIDVVDAIGNKIGEKVLVVAGESGRWCVDNRAVEVQPRMCVSFRDYNDAEFFLAQGRAAMVAVEVGMLVWFESEADAQFFVMRGLGEMLSPREVDALQAEIDAEIQAAQAEAEAAEDEEKMQNPDLENKGQPAPAQTKGKPAPKPAAKGKK